MSHARSVLDGKPSLSREQAESLLAGHWGLSARVRQLDSERDLNFLVNNDGAPRFVLKVANALDSRRVVDLQQAMMRRLRDTAAPVPEVVLSVGGDSVVTHDGHPIWLITLLPGTPMAQGTPVPTTFENLGALIGRAGRALDGFDHPAAHRTMQWDVLRAADVIERNRGYVGVRAHRALLERELVQLRRELLPLLDELPRAVVHNDANDHNVLIDDAGRITGLIDFGDALYSVRIHDLAVACAYAMFDHDDPAAIAALVIDGYERTWKPTDAERAAVPHLIRARLATSVAISAYQARETCDPYLSVSEDQAWRLLDRWEGDALWPTS